MLCTHQLAPNIFTDIQDLITMMHQDEELVDKIKAWHGEIFHKLYSCY